jgi:hypothetical protein
LSIRTLPVTAIEIKEQSNKVIKKKWNINERELIKDLVLLTLPTVRIGRHSFKLGERGCVVEEEMTPCTRKVFKGASAD